MALDPDTWYEAHEDCGGAGCEDCDRGLVPHGHQRQPYDVEPTDEVARLLASEDRAKAHLTWVAQMAGHFRDALIDEEFTEEGAENLSGLWLEEYLIRTRYQEDDDD